VTQLSNLFLTVFTMEPEDDNDDMDQSPQSVDVTFCFPTEIH
jgi:hypothetical protein